MRKTTFILPVLAIVLATVFSALFIVDEREKALVLQFGEVKNVIIDPGLAFKIPLIQEVVKYDDRILPLDTQPLEVTPADDRRLVVDAFARWRIADPVQFRSPRRWCRWHRNRASASGTHSERRAARSSG